MLNCMPPLLGLPCPIISHMPIIGPIVLRPTTTLHTLTICQHLPYCHIGRLVQPPSVAPFPLCPYPSGMVGLAEIAQTTSMLYFLYPSSLGWGSPHTRVAKGTITIENKILYAMVGIPQVNNQTQIISHAHISNIKVTIFYNKLVLSSSM
jgi:hypothetical protein